MLRLQLAGMEVEVARSFFQQLRGLMFKKDYRGVMAFVFRKPVRLSFHTFFMRFPLDIFFFLDARLIEERLDVPPWRVVKPRRSYNLVLEAKHGVLDRKKALELALALKSRKVI